MLDGVEPEAIDLNIVDHPSSPIEEILPNFKVTVVDVGEHKIVGVAVLVVNINGPVFRSSAPNGLALFLGRWWIDDLENGVLLSSLIPVGAIEMLPVPF